MGIHTSAGSTIKISAGTPATFDSTGYAALTFSTIGEVTDISEEGREYALVTHQPLGSRGTKKFKGSFNNGPVTVSFALDADDAGQNLAKAALISDSDYSFLITTQDGFKRYRQAKVMSFKVAIGSVDSMTTATCTLELSSFGDVDVDPAA